MIFLTVGHQTPFDRLVKAMDEWAASNPQEVIQGQIGEGSYTPKNFPCERWLSADEFDTALNAADCIVAHAGTGTIIEALAIDAAMAPSKTDGRKPKVYGISWCNIGICSQAA